MDDSPPARHAPPHIRLNSGSGGDLLDMQSPNQEEQPRSPAAQRAPSTRSLIPQNRPASLRHQSSQASGIYQSQQPAESAEQLLLPPRKSRSRRYRDEDSPLPSGVNSRRTSWSSGSDGSRDSRGYGGPFISPFDDSRAPSRAGSDDDGVNTQTVSEKYNILPSAGLLLFPEDVEKDDWLHTPDPNERDRMNCSDFFSKRGIVNVGGLALITLGVLTLFIGFPILTFARSLIHPATSIACEEDASCISASVPLLKNVRTGLIDPDTPSSAKYKTDSQGNSLQLAFSDEFNDDGRTFYEQDDAYYQGVDIWYGVTQDLEWYDPDAISTSGGTLNIRFDAFKNHDLNYRSGMLQSWNMLCFKSGMMEASISLPGAGDAVGFWPGWWTMGNLGRPGYAATTDGMWPYSYHDECDAGITANQSQIDGINWLPGMRLPGCTCGGASNDNPSPGTARSAPEIDAIEASNYALNNDASQEVGSASQSFQVAPFDIWYRPDPEYQEIYDYTLTQINEYQGGPYQQAISALTTLNADWYDGKAYQSYGYEYEPGAEGYITWWVGDQPTWSHRAEAVRPNGNVGQRIIPEEPMALVVNFGMSNGFSFINVPAIQALLPATMRIDYIRIYQDEDGEMSCDPEGYPTTDYINAHPEAYQNQNNTHWEAAGYSTPTNSFVDGCSSDTTASASSTPKKEKKMKRSERRALRRKREAERLQKRGKSWWPWS